MARDQPSSAKTPSPVPATLWRDRWFAGLTWKGVALVVLMCALNALRRAMGSTPYELIVSFAEMFGLALIVLFPPTLAIVAAYNRAPTRWRYPVIALAILVTSAAGFALMTWLESRGDVDFFRKAMGDASRRSVLPNPVLQWAALSMPRYLVLGPVIAVVFVFFRTREASEAATQRDEVERELFARQMDEARLQMLQAQIEPHFLFNTLANVRRLYQSNPATGETMLDNLMRYLAVALPQMRAADTTLDRERTLAESYLNIQRIRMGRRLAFEIDIPERLRDARIPPLMLLTLIENAIKHGLNPLPEGGFIRVSARVADGELRLQVADTGQGFTKSSGGGTGLANARARLAAVYGPQARLALALNQPRGVTASIAIPWANAEAAAAA